MAPAGEQAVPPAAPSEPDVLPIPIGRLTDRPSLSGEAEATLARALGLLESLEERHADDWGGEEYRLALDEMEAGDELLKSGSGGGEGRRGTWPGTGRGRWGPGGGRPDRGAGRLPESPRDRARQRGRGHRAAASRGAGRGHGAPGCRRPGREQGKHVEGGGELPPGGSTGSTLVRGVRGAGASPEADPRGSIPAGHVRGARGPGPGRSRRGKRVLPARRGAPTRLRAAGGRAGAR